SRPSGLTPYEFFGAGFWLGFVLHLMAAEAWIHWTQSQLRADCLQLRYKSVPNALERYFDERKTVSPARTLRLRAVPHRIWFAVSPIRHAKTVRMAKHPRRLYPDGDIKDRRLHRADLRVPDHDRIDC